MRQWESKKWIFFASRPTTILNRQFRKEWYLGLNKISQLSVSGLLVIGVHGSFRIYLRRHDDQRNNRLILEDFQATAVERLLNKILRTAQRNKVPGRNPVERAIYSHHNIGSTLFYSHYLERILTKQIQRINKLVPGQRRRLLKLINLNSKFRDTVVKIQDKHFNQARRFLIQKYPKVSSIDYYTLEELASGKILTAKQVRARERFCVQLADKFGVAVFSGRQAKELLRREQFKYKKVAAINGLRGLSAYTGKAEGRAYIVRKASDFKKVRPKSIIIAPMTTVQFVPFLKGIKALVTDEGGINCHAAVVARELRIPCVVGTKEATQVFKDGDKVEVDANRGVVKKVK